MNLNIIPVVPVKESQSQAVFVTNTVGLAVVWAAICLRFYTRACLTRALGLDDWLALVSAVIFTLFAACLIALAIYVKGRTFLDVKHQNILTTLFLCADSFYISGMVVLKLALSLFFLRIMVEPWQRYSIYVMAAISTTFGCAFFIFCLFICGSPNPVEQYWRKFAMGKCVDPITYLVMGYTYATIGLMSDLLLLLLPLPMVFKARISVKEKVIVAIIFSVAIFGTIASAIRIQWIADLGTPQLEFWGSMVNIGIWSTIELALGITAACMATLRPLLRQLRGSSTSSSTSHLGLSLSNKQNMSSSNPSNRPTMQSVSSDVNSHNASFKYPGKYPDTDITSSRDYDPEFDLVSPRDYDLELDVGSPRYCHHRRYYENP